MTDGRQRGEKTAGREGGRIAVLLLCFGFSFVWALAARNGPHAAMDEQDIGQLYYAARCVINHADPYDHRAVIRQIEADTGKAAPVLISPDGVIQLDWTEVYPATAFFVTAPLALLPGPVAGGLWFGLVAASLALAGLLAWDLGKSAAPVVAVCLAGFMLANSPVLLTLANPAALAVGFCVIAAWCFLKERYARAGALLLAVSLMLKPHDGGFVWLYFLLAGGTGRKRALQTLAVATILGIGTAVWIAPASPHWIEELHGNLTRVAVRGGDEDPGPTGYGNRTLVPEISLQNTMSIFRDDSHFYNPATYLIAGSLILAWMIAVLRKRTKSQGSPQALREGALLALAAISAPELLLVYHRSTDAKLLLLMIPACAMLWAAGGAKRWIALGLTAAAILVTSDVPIILLVSATGRLPVSTATLGGKLMLLLMQPAPVVLLAAGSFYVWVYIRYRPSAGDVETQDEAVSRAAEAAAI